ncbi:PREDICTED: uncharacterized protein LOC106099430 [Papilio polytes]|uniref:uncharacterized protein LOC106099430 n=1 Tax=Papilio polytes TaxID=76194 RepID=UPI0006769E5C|nr:PREDICTED: uncharacterized protein LOC106099430 [Papilio polytes]
MGRIAAGAGGGQGVVKQPATTNGSLAIRLRYLFLIATVFGGSYIIISLTTYTNTIFVTNEAQFGFSRDLHHQKEPSERYTIRTKGCSIPGLDPYDEHIKEFVEFPRDMESCPNVNKTLLNNNRTHIWVLQDNKPHYNISEDQDFSCCYKAFHRPATIQDIDGVEIDDRIKYQDCVYFDDFIKVTDEFVRVFCYSDGAEIYQQFFLFAPHKEFMSHGTKEISDEKRAYNVIVMGIDAVSRMNFHRTMPKTLQFLKSKGTVELVGYNKVGDNTFPNLIPLLLGIKESELKTTCLPYDQLTFDNCPFVWEWFKQAGYYTALGEDSSLLGSFNYLRVGFSKTPTDYYLHTFVNEAETNAGKVKDFNSYLCMDEKYFFQVLLDYIEDLTITLRSSKLFGFFWEITMSHDYLNYPMIMDTSYELFFKKLERSNYLDDTIVVLLSDHGIRWGKIRSTKQGRLEERLPFVNILVPPSFRETYVSAYNNLRINSRRLTTPFDLHETLNDLVDLKNIEDEKIRSRSNEFYAYKRGISLFLPIPDNRTCEMASIEDHWCTCHKGKKISKDNSEAMEAAAHLVRQLNSLLSDHVQCAKLALSQLIDVTEMEVGTPSVDEVGWREFMVTVETTPGNGIFEATLRQSKIEWTLAGTISRLNLYGDQSICIHNYQLKLYCYCQ